ncbi:MAG: hydroxyacylglutathione hydrolase [Halobacteriovoraceae bacterium]|jgi:hydroxyacylglutathione hydrolase|nr:hydroxyacylglutathione hydrolase [Halobacteriovoraceae bacterium]MBT5094647.1 hydroxyacylglutathione hydrolase [Halobacteriovoraceae bacterium]
MKVHQIYTGSSLRNFSYIIQSSDGLSYVVDPYDGRQVLDFIKKIGGALAAIINTHEHWDHTQGNSEIVRETKCAVWAHSNAEGKIKGVTRFLEANEIISLGGDDEIEVLDTPGHTFAHLCLLLRENSKPIAVLTGDTLFNAGVGNCHNGGDPSVLYETVMTQLKCLPDDVLIYPGHEYLGNNLCFTLDREPSNQSAKGLLSKYNSRGDDFMVTNIQIEKEVNTFFRLNNSEIINNLSGETSSPKEVFLRLRELRNNW